jgi:cytochrome c556
MKRKVVTGVMIVLVVAGVAVAQFSKPEKAITYRKSVMFLIAQHFGRMGAMVKGSRPYQKEDFAQNAAVVDMLAGLPWDAFTEPGTAEGDTTMSASVFKRPSKFKAAAQSFETDTGKLADLAASGDFDAARAQFGVVAKNCKSCHTDFRVK